MAKQNHIFTRIRTGSQAERLAEALSQRGSENKGKQISTIKALRDAGMGLRISCTACNHAVTLSGKAMVSRLGAETALSDLKDPCPNCSSKAVNRIPVSL